MRTRQLWVETITRYVPTDGLAEAIHLTAEGRYAPDLRCARVLIDGGGYIDWSPMIEAGNTFEASKKTMARYEQMVANLPGYATASEARDATLGKAVVAA